MLSRYRVKAFKPHSLGASQLTRQHATQLQRLGVRRSASTVSSQFNASSTRKNTTAFKHQRQFLEGKRTLASTTETDVQLANRKAEIYTLIDNIHRHEDELAKILDDLFLEDYDHILGIRSWDIDNAFSGHIGHRNYQALEARVRQARQEFGEVLPDDHLNAAELELYNTLYGEAINPDEVLEETDDKQPDILLKDDGQGGFEEVEFEHTFEEDVEVSHNIESELDEESAIERVRQVANELGGVLVEHELQDEEDSQSAPRLHPLTEAGKFATDPKTVFIPHDTVTGPVGVILSNYSNKHIAEATHKVFGGRRLPHSTVTLPPRTQIPQLPIPLSASQHHMSEMEANAYIAALYPGIYAATLSVLVEVRKRLGSKWLRNLITQETGPRVLDAGGGGAGILAWRDVLRAEYETMVPGHPPDAPVPTGKSTVLAGSNSLQLRASAMLDNTTFLPRLPDYVHVRDTTTLDDERAPPKRKQFDVIIAPHTLLEIEEDYLRKQHVKNLWALLNPNGGVLILLEKGRQRGFEAVAGAREMLLERHIASPGSTEYDGLGDSGDMGSVKKEPGMIIAPCTNHGKCPMYHIAGQAKGRGDYCHFEQRFIRPAYLQRIIGARDRNHEDVEFSYVAIQRGVDMRDAQNIVQGKDATNAAFEGYEDNLSVDAASDDTAAPPTSFNTLSLPRMVLSPIKRRGHVILDLCTPEGKIERWTVPRSFSRQAYHDARKARWGDLWALGAKTRIPRHLKLGTGASEDSKKERLQRRAASRLDEIGETEDPDSLDPEPQERQLDPALTDALTEQAHSLQARKKGQNIPSWKKNANKKRIRQAFKKVSSKREEED
ncbi:37S ribosomal protein Rsm22 [Talaromyces proteolyticus]|uniref:37S ribosomal protein Rsm22 n=1 Tax=Talaromyces proteolyticus TaxID=1131652 RepID=A0AAD4KKC0_9EURO|nr:37S ribosomal protein Rsm22 [Talaromyces proteolyticus]KAH8692983.1 37S ribosomal protein Rsm22 [Talaromyces proteolyticus]